MDMVIYGYDTGVARDDVFSIIVCLIYTENGCFVLLKIVLEGNHLL